MKKFSASLLLLSLTLLLLCSVGCTRITAEDLEHAKETAYNEGYNSGYEKGEAAASAQFDVKYEEGYSSGLAEGFDEGLAEGLTAAGDSFTQGYDQGYLEGYAKQEKDEAAARQHYIATINPKPPVQALVSTGSPGDAPSDRSLSEDPASVGNVVYVTKSGKKYHSGGCSYLSSSKIEKSLADAKAAGYTPCSKCNPPK